MLWSSVYLTVRLTLRSLEYDPTRLGFLSQASGSHGVVRLGKGREGRRKERRTKDKQMGFKCLSFIQDFWKDLPSIQTYLSVCMYVIKR